MPRTFPLHNSPFACHRRTPACAAGAARRFTLLLLAAAVFVAPAMARAQRTVAQQYLFQALNASRIAVGLPSLAWNDQLTRTALEHAEVMGRDGVVAHRLEKEADLPERAAASGVRFSVIAENIGVSSTASDLHDLWIHSPDHLDNILDPTVNSVGIAVRESGGYLWAVEDFASTSSELSLSQQESRVAGLLLTGGIRSAATEDAREMCRESSGYVGTRPAFVMRFNATELTYLPVELQSRLQRGGISRAAVGACTYPQASFAVYSVAVALYR